MKTLRIFLILFVSVCSLLYNVKAQNNKVLFTIADKEKVTTEEFMQMYEKNSAIVKDNNSDIEDYLNLYINYKLKLLQAYELGIDKDSSTIQQIKEYRSSLIKPYVNPPAINDSLLMQAYERMNKLIRVSQILISVPTNIAPVDTIAYYQKAQMIYQKALRGENFVKLVDEYSDDPSAKQTKGTVNNGDLGYFTSMNMIYPFEQACYSLIEDKTSKNKTLKDSIAFCKTRFGYHIIKLNKVIENTPARFTFAHIFISKNKHTAQECKDLIEQAYNQISTIGFDSVAKTLSDDSFSAKNGGLLLSQRPNTIPSEYIDIYFNNKIGEITKPFETKYGWHIVKPLSSVPVPEFEEIRPQIQDRISKDERAVIGINQFIVKSKKDYGFKYDDKALTFLPNIITDSVFSATWQLPDMEENSDLSYLQDKFLFSIGDSIFTDWDLLEFIFENQSKITPIHLQTYIDEQFENYSKKCILDYATSHFETQYPKIRESVKEFESGVMIFDLTDRMVWSKSLSDTVALEKFYQDNKSKYLYTQRADATIWTADKSIDVEQLLKKISKYKRKGKSNDEVSTKINKKYKKQSKIEVNYNWGCFEQGLNNIIDKNIFMDLEKIKKESFPYGCIDTVSISNRNVVIILNDILPISIKPFSACKGLVTSDYQDYLEKQWIKDLKAKYPVSINKEVLNTLK